MLEEIETYPFQIFQAPDTWLDSAGNWHSCQRRVEERYTMESENVIWYAATITDPEVYTEPWSIRLPRTAAWTRTRRCSSSSVSIVEDLLYGQYRKPAVE